MEQQMSNNSPFGRKISTIPLVLLRGKFSFVVPRGNNARLSPVCMSFKSIIEASLSFFYVLPFTLLFSWPHLPGRYRVTAGIVTTNGVSYYSSIDRRRVRRKTEGKMWNKKNGFPIAMFVCVQKNFVMYQRKYSAIHKEPCMILFVCYP